MIEPIDRRTLLGAAAIGLGTGAAAATPPLQIGPIPAGSIPAGFAREPIWPGDVPGGAAVRVREEEIRRSPAAAVDDTAFVHVTRPTLTSLAPARPNGAALLLLPGGGYRRVAIGHEGHDIARRFAAAGFHCFTLVYRLPADGWAAGPDAPLQDAQRALRIVRARAGRLGYDPARIGTIGFSAGGHLAARLAYEADRLTYRPVDAADRLSARPQVAALLYPVILMAGDKAHSGSRDELLGRAPSPQALARFSAERAVNAAAPPTFIAAAVDDAVVPVDNSLAAFAALRAAGVASELHLFERGGHGFALRLPDGTQSPWPDLFLAWSRRHGLLP